MRLVCEHGRACGSCRSCVFAAKGDHPDILVIKAEEGKAEITVDHARALNAFLALTPHLADRRVSIIEAAEQLNRSAANALLKTLEEPPAESFVLLVSHAPAQLLPTIRSRCQQVHLQKPSRAEGLDYLKAQGLGLADAALKIAHGAPLRAVALPKDALNTAFRLLETLEQLARGAVDAVSAGEGWQTLDLGYGLSLFTGILADIVQLLKREWAKEGIQVTLKGTPFEQVVSTEGQGVLASKWDMAWSNGWAYEPDYFPSGGGLFRGGASADSGGYNNVTMNALINATYQSGTPAQSKQRMDTYQVFASKHLPVLWMAEPTGYNEVASWLHGFNKWFNPITTYNYPNHWTTSKS
jgi:DNA polymerase III delta' subunit